jgi:predicted Zn-dependent peptidase
VESNPQGRLVQALLATAFAAHPYRHMGLGWPSDLAALRAGDAEQFFRTYYTPSNITIAMAGDVDPAQAKQLAARYFSAIPAGVPPPLVPTREPPQHGPKRVQVEAAGDPLLYVGYKRPDFSHKDDAVFDVIAGMLGGDRGGMLYTELVRDKKLALAARTQPTFPGARYENLFLLFLAPARGVKLEEAERALYDLLARFQARPADEVSLSRAKTQLRAAILRRMDSNPQMAAILATARATYGSWKDLFAALAAIENVSPVDVMRVSRRYFVPNGRTVVHTIPPGQSSGER